MNELEITDQTSNVQDCPDFPLTDAGNGERLMHRHGNKLKFVAFWNKPIVYHAGYWRSDDTRAADRLAVETIRSIRVAGARLAESDDPISQRQGMKLLKHALACESRNRVKDILSMGSIVKGATILPVELDRDPWKLNVQNGTINLRTGELLPHQREDFIFGIDASTLSVAETGLPMHQTRTAKLQSVRCPGGIHLVAGKGFDGNRGQACRADERGLGGCPPPQRNRDGRPA